jgi:hypothetical protein
LAPHLRYAEAASRKLARSIFYGMLVYRARLERRQGFLFRVVDVAMEVFAMTAVVARAQQMRLAHHPAASEATELADVFCRTSRRFVDGRLRALWENDDAQRYALGRHVLEGRNVWLEEGIVGVRRAPEELAPKQAAATSFSRAP